MALKEGLVLCSLLWILPTAEGKGLIITCLHSEECVLPCQFQSDGKGARVMWYKKKAVVSCTRYGNTSFVIGHNSPADMYKGRTDLFRDQVLEGNATLLLKNVTASDQGKYYCVTYTQTRTDESSIVSVIVKALVREVNIEFSGNLITCRAANIFPAPTLSWATDPPSDTQLLMIKTKTMKNDLGFYNIESSMVLPEDNTLNQTYTCCVSSNTSRKTVFLKHEASIQVYSGSDVMVACSLPHIDVLNFNLTWRFQHTETILSISKSRVQVWDRWKSLVTSAPLAWRHLQLHSLETEHQGTFTCEINTPEHTYITSTDVTVKDVYRKYINIIVTLAVFLCVAVVTGAVITAVMGNRIFAMKKAERERERKREQNEGTTVNLNGTEVATVQSPAPSTGPSVPEQDTEPQTAPDA